MLETNNTKNKTLTGCSLIVFKSGNGKCLVNSKVCDVLAIPRKSSLAYRQRY